MSTSTNYLDPYKETIQKAVADGKTYNEVAKMLNKMGVKAVRGGAVSGVHLSQYLIANGHRKVAPYTHTKTRKKDGVAPSSSRKSQEKAELLACEILQRKDVPRDLKKRLVNTILDQYANEF